MFSNNKKIDHVVNLNKLDSTIVPVTVRATRRQIARKNRSVLRTIAVKQLLDTANMKDERIVGFSLSFVDFSQIRPVLIKNILRSNIYINCRFDGLDLTGWNMALSTFVECSFKNTNLTDTNFYRASFSGCEDIIGPAEGEGYLLMGFRPKTNSRMLIRGGCRTMTLDEAKKHTTGRPECAAFLKYAEAVAKERGWRVR